MRGIKEDVKLDCYGRLELFCEEGADGKIVGSRANTRFYNHTSRRYT